jgi:regulator of protease activity HflC (stomatin/prohibitin superfamily)
MEFVSKEVTAYFIKERGITLSNVGYKGDIIFDDPKVQDAMNAKFTAIQEQDAEAIRRETAQQNAKAQIEVEKNNALAKEAEAEGIAKANRIIQQSLTGELIQKQWIEKWNGMLPTVQSGAGGMMVQVPAPTATN